MNKRIIASILTVIMLMTMLPTAAFAADGESTETGDSTTPPTMAQMAMTRMKTTGVGRVGILG